MTSKKPAKAKQTHTKHKPEGSKRPLGHETALPALDQFQDPHAGQSNKADAAYSTNTSQNSQEITKPFRRIELVNIVLTLIFSGLLVIATWTYTIYSRKQLDAVTEQARLMNEGLKESVKTRELENAAFIGTKGAKWNQPLHVGEWQKISVTIINTGKTPAFNLKVEQGWVFQEAEPTDLNMQQRGPASGIATVIPGVDNLIEFYIPNLTEEDVSAITNFKKLITVYGKIKYDDIFGKPHWTNFCLTHHPTTEVFDICTKGNESDYQYQKH
jgi:hypothetical protein